jgi:hypothetical protein
VAARRCSVCHRAGHDKRRHARRRNPASKYAGKSAAQLEKARERAEAKVAAALAGWRGSRNKAENDQWKRKTRQADLELEKVKNAESMLRFHEHYQAQRRIPSGPLSQLRLFNPRRRGSADLVALEYELAGLKRELVTARRGLSSRDRIRRQRAVDEVANLERAASKVEDRIIWIASRTRAAAERATRPAKPARSSKPAQLRLFNPRRRPADDPRPWELAPPKPKPSPMFAAGQDLPLFSGTPWIGRPTGRPRPTPSSSQARLFNPFRLIP